jgi:hypothetical protein
MPVKPLRDLYKIPNLPTLPPFNQSGSVGFTPGIYFAGLSLLTGENDCWYFRDLLFVTGLYPLGVGETSYVFINRGRDCANTTDYFSNVVPDCLPHVDAICPNAAPAETGLRQHCTLQYTRDVPPLITVRKGVPPSYEEFSVPYKEWLRHDVQNINGNWECKWEFIEQCTFTTGMQPTIISMQSENNASLGSTLNCDCGGNQ